MNKIKTTEPKVLWKLICKLGEGTLWVKEHNSIYFVDIKKKKFFSLNIKNNKVIEHIQALITITALSAWLLIGFKMYLIGWSFMLISHCLLAYVYKQKKANYYVWLQIISIIIAFIKLIVVWISLHNSYFSKLTHS